jgi:hypothetical protein
MFFYWRRMNVLFSRTMLMSLTWCFCSTSHTLFQVIWGINICDLKIVVLHVYQLSIFIVSVARILPRRYTSPPRPTRTCGSPHWEGENLICLRWWSEAKELFRVTVKSWIFYFTPTNIGLILRDRDSG